LKYLSNDTSDHYMIYNFIKYVYIVLAV